MTTTRNEFIAETAARLIAARIITYSGAVDEACFLAGRLEACGVAPWQDDETVGIEAVELCRQAVKAECAAKEAALRDLADLRAKLAAAEKERDAALAALSVERERSAASTLVDGSDAEAATAKGLIVEAIRNEREKREAAEAKRDEWERGYDAMSAEVAKIRTALVGLTLPRADLTAEVEALREALRVERAACDRAAGLIDDDESESRRQWRREYDARRAAAKAKPKRAVAFGHGASWFVSIGTLGTPAFPSKESAAAFAAAINGEGEK